MFAQNGFVIRYSLLTHLNYQQQFRKNQMQSLKQQNKIHKIILKLTPPLYPFFQITIIFKQNNYIQFDIFIYLSFNIYFFLSLMKNKHNITQLKSQYKAILNQIKQQNLSNLQQSRIERQQSKLKQVLQDMSNNNIYDDYDECIIMQQKYRQLNELIKDNMKNKLNKSQYIDKLKHVYLSNKESTVKQNNQLAESNSSGQNYFNVEKSKPRNTGQNFFQKKQKEIKKKDSSFKIILQNKDFKPNHKDRSSLKLSNLSKSSLKKKQEQKQKYLKRIIDQHKKMVNSLQYKVKSQQQLNQFQKNLLKQQKNRYLQKIQEMQTQIQQLYRDNFRLKQLEKTKQLQTFNITSQINKQKDGHGYQPYILKTQSNDLNKINERNFKKSQEKVKNKKNYHSPEKQDYLGYKLEKEKPLTAMQFFNKQNKAGGLYEQKYGDSILKYLEQDQVQIRQKQQKESKVGFGMQKNLNYSKDEEKLIDIKKNSFRHENSRNISYGSINQGSRFDTFQMANTLSLVHDSVLGQSRQGTRMNGEVSTRNKVAFFKNSLVLVRQPNIQIAYKKSDLNQKMDKLRLIFYINNKTNSQKKVKIIYQYQQQYFSITVVQKLTKLDANSQGRQVIEVQLISKLDLNGVTDLHIEIDNEVYDLWLPVNFIRFKTSNNYRMIQNQTQMTVLPDRQFSTFENIKQVLPFMYGGKDQFQQWIYLYGQSKFGNYSIKLTWKQNQLLIQCNQKWIDFIGFVFHFFK